MQRGQPEEAQLRALVKGRVQGVNFRYFVVTRARALGLRGNVGNLPNGQTVEVNAQGSRGRLEQLVRDLRTGPRGARVDTVSLEWQPLGQTYRGFTVV